MNLKRLTRCISIFLIIALLLPTAMLFMLYLPPVQGIAKQWTTAWFTERTGMKIEVQKLLLLFPLKIEMEEVRVGTLLSIGKLSTNIHLFPLREGIVKIDYISAIDVDIHPDTNTDISLRRFRADDMSYHWHKRKVHLQRILLDDGNIASLENTTSHTRSHTRKNLPLDLTVSRVILRHIRANYTNSQMEIQSYANRAILHNIVADTALCISLPEAKIEGGIFTFSNPQHTIHCSQVSARADSLHYSPTSLTGQLTHLAFKESHGINLQEGTITFSWHERAVSLPHFSFRTDHSEFNGHLTTFDYGVPDMAIDGNATLHLGHADAQLLAKWAISIPKELMHLYPSETLHCSVALAGTMKRLQLTQCYVSLPTVFNISMKGNVQGIDTPKARTAECWFEARTYDIDFLTTLMKDSTLQIPQDATYKGNLYYNPDTLHALCTLILNEGSATIEAGYSHRDKAYTVYLQTDSLDIRQFTSNGEMGAVSLQAHITGYGTDHTDANTKLRGTLWLRSLQWKEQTFTNASARIAIEDQRLRAHISYNDSLMQWSIGTSAKYASDAVEASIHAQIKHLDMQALHLTHTDIHPSLQCHATLHIDSGEVYTLRAHLADIVLTTSTQRIHPRPLTLQSMLSPDTALLTILSGDLALMTNAHTEGLPWQWRLYINPLRHITDLQAKLTVGNDNPVSDYLALMGIEADSLSFTARYTDDTLRANLKSGLLTWQTPRMKLQGRADGDFTWGDTFTPDSLSGMLRLTALKYTLPAYNLKLFSKDTLSIPFKQGSLFLNTLPIYTADRQPLLLKGRIAVLSESPTASLHLTTTGTNILFPQATREGQLYGKALVNADVSINGPFKALSITGNLKLLPNSSIHYMYRDAILTANNQLNNVVTFVRLAPDSQSASLPKVKRINGGLSMNMSLYIDPNAQIEVILGASEQNRVSLQGGGTLNLQYTPTTGLRLAGKYGIETGQLNMNIPLLHVSNMTIRQRSTIVWSGNPKNPMLDISAEERIRASVTLDGSPQSIVFIAGVSLTETVEKLGVQFTLTAPENASMQNTLASFSPEERGKLAVALLTTGLYLGEGGTGNLMNTALMSILQSQLDNISRDAFRTVDVSVGIEPLPDGVSGVSTRTDYSFSISKRLWNNRIRIIIGGSVTTNNERIEEDVIIDNISIEWRITPIGNQYLRFFYEKNFKNILEGELRETGVGYAYRRRF